MSRIGLDRHSRSGSGEPADDPLDGLVNLFDLGLVLAVAFLVAGLSIGASAKLTPGEQQQAQRTTPGATKKVEIPQGGRSAQGAGTAVGTVYQLPDGTLVLQDEAGTPTTP